MKYQLFPRSQGMTNELKNIIEYTSRRGINEY